MISRTIVTAMLAAVLAFAAPPLTTIQDVLYKADGTRFSGTLTIRWNSFEASDSSAITMQSTSVKVVNGMLRVQLVPTANSTPAAYYTVVYNSDGRVQFQETWSVPVSAQAVRVRDVRVDTAPAGGQVASGSTAPIQETDVTGLVADLSQRPVKGAAFAGGRVALVNDVGALESVAGDPSECVHVDGSTGPCGSAASFMDGDVPAGIADGANRSFMLTSQPNPVTSLAVYRNGLLQKAGQDYTLAGSTLQFVAAAVPMAGDTLLAAYRVSGDSGAATPVYPGTQVLCAGTGTSITATAMSTLATCSIPAGVLLPGDRVEVRGDIAHLGATSGFSFEIHWGATTLGHRDAAAGDAMATLRAEGGLDAAGAQLGCQSWGTVLPFATGVAAASDAYANGITVEIAGRLASGGDILSMRNFAVVRVP